MAAIETSKFQNMVTSLGAENIGRIATSGHDNQVSHALVQVPGAVRREGGRGQCGGLCTLKLRACVLLFGQVNPCSPQLAMLQALGLQSTLITDGSTPLNLFNTAKGLVGALPSIE